MKRSLVSLLTVAIVLAASMLPIHHNGWLHPATNVSASPITVPINVAVTEPGGGVNSASGSVAGDPDTGESMGNITFSQPMAHPVVWAVAKVAIAAWILHKSAGPAREIFQSSNGHLSGYVTMDLGPGGSVIETFDMTYALINVSIDGTNFHGFSVAPPSSPFSMDMSEIIYSTGPGHAHGDGTLSINGTPVAPFGYSVDFLLVGNPTAVIEPNKETLDASVTYTQNSLSYTGMAAPSSVGGVSLDPGAGALPLQSQPSSGSDAWLLTEAIAGTAATALALGVAAWYVRRRQVR
jgi:hypothetical protein